MSAVTGRPELDDVEAPPAEVAPTFPPRPGEGDPPPVAGGFGPAALARRFWRWLTSMRTALVLLFLLALAAIPGSLLPQRNISTDQVRQYFTAHPKLAPFLDRLWAFNVFSSPWFSAIYLLLFVSLVGCLVPRLRGHVVSLLRPPPEAPSRLDRMPAHAGDLLLAGEPGAIATDLRTLLRGEGRGTQRFGSVLRRFWPAWRVAVREQPDGGYTVAAERGYLKETGNLLFHFALLAMLVGVAVGSWYGYHADRLVVQGPDQAFCNTLQQYDSYGLGARVGPGDLPPFCLEMTGFTAKYLDNGQPIAFSASVSYTVGTGSANSAGNQRAATISPNHPLRLPRAWVYLIGHGYAPVIRYVDRYGHAQTVVAPFLPQDGFETSSGVAEFPDANVVPGQPRDPANPQQVAFSGIYLPTAPSDPSVGRSAYPGERNPALMLVAYRGDLGVDAGLPMSVYSLDQGQIDSGRLKKVGQPMMLRPGQSATLDDGGTVTFLGTRPWATVEVKYDPGETTVLAGGICLLLGLLTSLTGRRRRLWVRLPARTGEPVTAGALARGEYLGLAGELDEVLDRAVAAGHLRRTEPPEPPPPQAARPPDEQPE